MLCQNDDDPPILHDIFFCKKLCNQFSCKIVSHAPPWWNWSLPVVDTNEDDIFIRLQFLSDLSLPVIHGGYEVIVKNQAISQILNDVFEEP